MCLGEHSYRETAAGWSQKTLGAAGASRLKAGARAVMIKMRMYSPELLISLIVGEAESANKRHDAEACVDRFQASPTRLPECTRRDQITRGSVGSQGLTYVQ